MQTCISGWPNGLAKKRRKPQKYHFRGYLVRKPIHKGRNGEMVNFNPIKANVRYMQEITSTISPPVLPLPPPKKQKVNASWKRPFGQTMKNVYNYLVNYISKRAKGAGLST